MSNRSEAARHAPCTKPKVPTGISGWLWNASARSILGPSITPSAIIAFMPPMPSSAGWNTSFTVPASCGARSFSTAATPSSVVVWMSWPQACIRPGLVLANGRPDFSSIGSASMSARMASTGPGRPPSIRPTTPVRPMPVWWLMPSRVSSRATTPAVRTSSKPSSGWAWMSRRISISAGSMRCVASRIAVVGSLGRLWDMTGAAFSVLHASCCREHAGTRLWRDHARAVSMSVRRKSSPLNSSRA